MRPRVILVTGAPGSGKSTLARLLAEQLRLPYLARDDVRGGLAFSAGAWSGPIDHLPTGEDAVALFLRVVETLLSGGASCVAEYVVRSHRPADLDRIVAAGECCVIRTRSESAIDRFADRNRNDRLLARQSVLDALGHESIEAHTVAAIERMRRVESEMRHDFPVPVLDVDTTDGYDPPLEQIIEFVTQSHEPQTLD